MAIEGPISSSAVADGSVTTAKIAADAVTYAKMQNVSGTDKVLGRSSGGAGDVEEIACTAFGRSLIDDANAAAALTTLGAAGLASPTFTGSPAAPTLTLDTTTPSAPASDKVIAFGKDVGGRQMLAMRGPTGQVTPLSPHLGFSKRSEWLVTPNSSITPTGIGMASPNVSTGTPTGRTLATGSMYSFSKRYGQVSAGASGSSAAIFGSVLLFGLGDAAGAGGFTYVCRFGISDAGAVANARMFVGLRNSITAIGNVEPSSLTDIIGVGCDAGGTTLSMMHNDGAGSATTVSLGANFPADTRSTDIYQLEMFCVPNGSSVTYRVTRLNTGDTTAGTLSSNLPSSTTLMAAHCWRNNGATAAAVGLDLMGLYIETDV